MIKPINVERLPTYNPILLSEEKLIICKTIDNCHSPILIQNLTYFLPYVLAKKLQSEGILYFIEMVRYKQ